MGAGLSIAVACAAAYVGIIDVATLKTDAAIAIFKMALLGADALASSFGAVVLLLASKYKDMIKDKVQPAFTEMDESFQALATHVAPLD